jgi:tetratricopeptide (TPR) repeat protein
MPTIKAIALFLLCFSPTLLPADAEPTEVLRQSMGQFPKLEFGKDENGFARVHQLAPTKTVEIDGWHYHAFRFTTPEWLDHSVLFMFLHPEQNNEKVGRFKWLLAPVEGGPIFNLGYIKSQVRAFQALGERFPHSRDFFIQNFPLERLEPGKEYFVWFCYQQRQAPKLAVALTVKSDKGLEEFGILPTGRPALEARPHAQGTPPPDLNAAVSRVAAAYRQGGRESGLRALDEVMTAVDRDGGHFRHFYLEIWREAQLRTGREDPDWGADIWDWMFRTSLARADEQLAHGVAANLLGSLHGSHRFGRAKEVLAWLENAVWRSGFELDPRNYADLGEGLATLPEIRRRQVPMEPPIGKMRIHPTGEFGVSKSFSFGDASVFLAIAADRERGGHWQEAMEWRVWAQSWATAKTELREDKKPEGEVSNIWYRGVDDNAGNLRLLGLTEAAKEEYQRIIESPWPDYYQGRTKLRAKLDRIDCCLDLGQFEAGFVEEAAELAKQAKANSYLVKRSWQQAMLTHARCLLAAGNQTDGAKMLDELISDGCEPARHERCLHHLKTGHLDGVEDDLKRLLAHHRSAGQKISEAGVYALYARFLEAAGRLDEALAMRRESIRLMRSFDLFPLLPGELARLSCLLAKCGDRAGSDAAAAEATRLAGNEQRIPARIREMVTSLLASRPQADNLSKALPEKRGTVDLQPLRSLVIPVAQRPLQGRLTLSNPTAVAVEGTLAFDGIPADAAWDEASGEAHVALGSAGVDRLSKVRIEPGSFAIIRLAAAPGAIGKGTLTTVWSAPGQKDQTSEWNIDDAEAGVSSAVIEAGEYQGNLFYSVPIHHHFVRADLTDGPADFRIVASAPARIELYDGEDQAVFVDAQGDGSLSGISDVLYTDRNSDGAGDIASKDGQASFRLQVFPEGAIAPAGLTLTVETKIAGDWVAVSEDRILP